MVPGSVVHIIPEKEVVLCSVPPHLPQYYHFIGCLDVGVFGSNANFCYLLYIL